MLCVFDVNETLLDLAALDGFFVDVAGTAAARAEWFELMIHNAVTLTAAGGYRPFGEIATLCLPAVAARHGRTANSDRQRELGDRMRALPAHPDAGPALERLRTAGLGVVALTNSVAAVAEDQLRNAGLRDLFDAVYSADQVRRLKPAPEPYRLVLHDRHIDPSGAVLIAAHDWDVAGAAAAGLRTAFVSRDGRVPLPAAPPRPLPRPGWRPSHPARRRTRHPLNAAPPGVVPATCGSGLTKPPGTAACSSTDAAR